MVNMSCPVCSSDSVTEVLELKDLPVAINAQATPDLSATVSTGKMNLVVCNRCTHLFNRSFDPNLSAYDSSYENSLHFSEHFRKHAQSLAKRLTTDYELSGEMVAEAGAGPGHFLEMLCEQGVAKAYGYDPSYDSNRLSAPEHTDVELSNDLFPDDGSINVKMAMSQHVMEHLEDPVELLSILRKATSEKQDGIVYTEVPNGDLMLHRCALWDLIYEHYSYFTQRSLRTAQSIAGLDTVDIGTMYADQFLYSVARPANPISVSSLASDSEKEIENAIDKAVAFGKQAIHQIDMAKSELKKWRSKGAVALWGAGSKGMTYLNLVAETDQIEAVVDVNPRKIGFGVPGTTFRISEPEALTTFSPKTVLIANPIYAAEIGNHLSNIGVDANVVPLWD